MDNERQLRAQVVSALEAVTPPAPWLASSVREALSAGPRPERGTRAAAGFSVRGLLPAVAVLLVLLLVATAVGIVAMRTFQHPVPAHHADSDAVRYAALLTQDKQLLDEAAGRELRVGGLTGQCDTGPYDSGCPARLSQLEGGYQRWLYDLDHTTPPARFAAEHARMRGDLLTILGALPMSHGFIGGMDIVVQPRDELLTIEAYVVYESTRAEPVRDAGAAAYLAIVARDYDNLDPPTRLSIDRSCEAEDSLTACSGPVADMRSAILAFLADLRAAPPPARFAASHAALVISLGTVLRNLDQVDAAMAAEGLSAVWPITPTASDNALVEAMHSAIFGLGGISIHAGEILYATD